MSSGEVKCFSRLRRQKEGKEEGLEGGQGEVLEKEVLWFQFVYFRPEGNRHKKRVRQPHNTAERHRQKVQLEGEYIMEDGGAGGGGGRAVHFNLPETNGYGMVRLLYILGGNI